MTKKRTNSAKTTDNSNKSAVVRKYKEQHPEAKPAEIARALSAQGVEVTASRVYTVLKSGSGNKVDIEQIKKAAELVRGFKGKSGDTLEAVRQVGSFVEECGSVEKAVKALEAYQELSKSLA